MGKDHRVCRILRERELNMRSMGPVYLDGNKDHAVCSREWLDRCSPEDWPRRAVEPSGTKLIWDGLSRVDGWASKHPEVIDYYFSNGKEEVSEYAARLLPWPISNSRSWDLMASQDASY